jgi:tetratricopeptide (TPR) repeat protein
MMPFLLAPICIVFAAAAVQPGYYIQEQAGINGQQTLKQAEKKLEDAKAKAQQAQQKAEAALLATARSLRLRNQHSAAAAIYAQFVADCPKSSRLFEARFWLAKSLFASQKWAAAANAFTEFLKHHSDQRLFSKQAKEDRIQCWKLLQKQDPKAALGLKDALKDQDEDIRILAALALAENKDASGRPALEQGLNNDVFGERCGLALWKLGIRRQPSPGESPAPSPRMFILRVKTADNNFEMRVPINFVAVIERNLPEEARDQMARNGADIQELAKLAKTAAKGQVLFEFKGDKGKTNIVILVD